MALSYDSGLTERVIGLAIEVHRHLGPGLLESADEEGWSFELAKANLDYRRQVPLPVVYKEVSSIAGIALVLS